jgi:hypothetical protein
MSDDIKSQLRKAFDWSNDPMLEQAADRIEKLEAALRGLMEYANDPVIPSEHGIADAPTTEQWRHFYRNYVQWVAELSKREITARTTLAELKGETDD